MSYFINPDGTVSFVKDRYDSAGNIVGYSLPTHGGHFGASFKDNSKPKKKRKNPPQPINPPKTDWVSFRNKTYEIHNIFDIDKLVQDLYNKYDDITKDDIIEIERFLSKSKRKKRLWLRYEYYVNIKKDAYGWKET